jgi:hypothetical protein
MSRRRFLEIMTSAKLADKDIELARVQGARDAATAQAWSQLPQALAPLVGSGIKAAGEAVDESAMLDAQKAVLANAGETGNGYITTGVDDDGIPTYDEHWNEAPEAVARARIGEAKDLQAPKKTGNLFEDIGADPFGVISRARAKASATATAQLAENVAKKRAEQRAEMKDGLGLQLQGTQQKLTRDAASGNARASATAADARAEANRKAAAEAAEAQRKFTAKENGANRAAAKERAQIMASGQLERTAAKLETPTPKAIEQVQHSERMLDRMKDVLERKRAFDTGPIVDPTLDAAGKVLPELIYDPSDRNAWRAEVLKDFNAGLKDESGAAVTASEYTRQLGARLNPQMDDGTFEKVAKQVIDSYKKDVEDAKARAKGSSRRAVVEDEVTVSNGNETLIIPRGDLAEAEADGFAEVE